MMRHILIMLVFFVCIFYTSVSHAVCTSSPINIISDVRWNCILPVTIGGVAMGSSGNPAADSADNTMGSQSPVCVCFDNGVPRVGLTLGYREPIRIYEAVKDPLCFPTFGFSIGSGAWGLAGDQGDGGNTDEIFQHIHEWMFFPWKLMDIFADVICMQPGGIAETAISIGDMTEFYIHKKSEATAAILYPETILFANPILVQICSADAIAALAEYNIDPLFWCSGGTSQYPMANFRNKGRDYIVSSHINIGQMVYTHHRELRLWGSIGNQGLCDVYPMPIWRKMQYRLQQVAPVPDVYCRRIGQPSMLWEWGKNPTGMPGADNIAAILWRKRDCCMF